MDKKPIETLLEARIDEVLRRGIFSDAKAWCRASVLADGSTLSTGYIKTLKARLRSGATSSGKYEYMEALARAAGVTRAWLIGESANERPEPGYLVRDTNAPSKRVHPEPEVKYPLWGELADAVNARPGLALVLAREPMRWHVDTVLRAMAFSSVDDDAWAYLLDGIEGSRIPKVVGGHADVLAATLVQIDARRTPKKSRRER